ncbi:MAG: hypothetical protein U0892_22965 [Pirellulales bacterium]
MEMIACIVIGSSLILGSIALAFLRRPEWVPEGESAPIAGEAIAQCTHTQLLLRRTINLLLFLSGLMIIATGFIPHEKAAGVALAKTWGMLWAGVILLLLVVLVLACFEAGSTIVGYRRAIPDAALRSFRRD